MQKQAVDTTEGPLMVVAGPGTGKTELLSVRAANILKKTDVMPENILCLTYTESGVSAMRKRLSEIIGPAAYKIAIHTFHSFSTEVINHNQKFFYSGANFRPADELNRYEIMKSIFSKLGPNHPLAGQMNGEYIYLKDAISVISELKTSGLTSQELTGVIEANELALKEAEATLALIFASGIKKTTAEALSSVIDQIDGLVTPLSIPGVPPIAEVMGDSLRIAVNQAQETNSTKPITVWRNSWMKKDDKANFVLKSRERQTKLHAISGIYDKYKTSMQEARLFDFDDMILDTVHALETKPELRFNLQEKYLYLMVDEFQDTNLAQMRILLSLVDNEVNEGRPNLMVVGDDDQAIYGFQGATVGNIHNFIEKFPDAPRVVLTDNYRSTKDILEKSRSVIILGEERLEKLLPDINKSLTAKKQVTENYTGTELIELSSSSYERSFIVEDIKKRLEAGQPAGSIAVLARRHHELVDLLPYFIEAGIKVNYERRDNVLELESIQLIEKTAELLIALLDGHHDKAEGMLPEILAHPSFDIDPITFWKLSVKAQKERKSWMEIMPDLPELAPIHSWLVEQSKSAAHTPLERMCDIIIGTPESLPEGARFTSPFYNYFFTANKLTDNPLDYLIHLDGLIAIRSRLREHYPEDTPTIRTLLNFIKLQREFGGTITSIQPASTNSVNTVNLMTAHSSKGLEFDTVYISGVTDSAWGEKARSRSRKISYPENLPLQPPGERIDDRLRLFYVAMTRAQKDLIITYSVSDNNGKNQLVASFLSGQEWGPKTIDLPESTTVTTKEANLNWYKNLIKPVTLPMKELLLPRLENYRLSATHLTSFLDITRGGPEGFIINNLLRFPQAPTAITSYGSAIHSTLQQAHAYTVATNEQRSREDILKDFETALSEHHLLADEFKHFLERGNQALSTYIDGGHGRFTPHQKTELGFAGQGVIVGQAKLTGILDVVDLEKDSLSITDYKTGKAVYDWKGKSQYEKIKLHHYRMQLLFYSILTKGSRDFSRYSVSESSIQFVEPTKSGDIIKLTASFTREEEERLRKLINIVWGHITSLDMPDTSNFEPTYKGMLAFEDYLIDQAQ